MDQRGVKRMLKLIKEDTDSFAKKAEMYYQKRPQLISHVEDFYRSYRSLAERYDNVTGELRKNISSDLQSQGSGVSDVGSEPPPSSNPRARIGTRGVGYDFFLRSGGSGSDLGTKEGDETSTLDSETESDDSSVNNYSSTSANSDHRGLRKRISELESELQKVQMQQEERNMINNTEDGLRAENDKLKTELQKYESVAPRSDVVKEDRNPTLEVDLRIMTEKLNDSEEEVKRLRLELDNKGPSNTNLQEKLMSAQKEILSWKSKLVKEKREVSKLQDRITRYKENLSDRDREIRAMRETLSDANKTLAEENMQLQKQDTKLSKERVLLDDTIREWDLRCQLLDEELRRMKIVKTELEGEIEKLKFDKTELKVKVNELNRGLTRRNEELEKEISRQRGVIKEQAEEKREVIRQLCFSLEHYRDGYQQMRQAIVGYNKRHPVMVS